VLKRVLDIFSPSESPSLEEFEKLYLEHRDFVRNSIYWMVGHEIANELTQDTFVKAWNGYSRFRRHSSFKTWIYAIAMNTTRDYLRKNSYCTSLNVENSETEYLQEGKQDLINNAIGQLTVKQREVFMLFYKFEYTYNEISKLTGVKEGTVKSRIQRSKEIFTSFLNEVGD
jgi:RNA polymerase sigma-70 factor (ECF subfamily)